MHVSGEQLEQLTGICAILRFPMQELDEDSDSSDEDEWLVLELGKHHIETTLVGIEPEKSLWYLKQGITVINFVIYRIARNDM